MEFEEEILCAFGIFASESIYLFELQNSKTKYYSLLLNKKNPNGLHVYSLAKEKGFLAVFQSIAFIISFY